MSQGDDVAMVYFGLHGVPGNITPEAGFFELCEEQPDWYTIVARGQGQDTPVKFLANVLAQEVRLVEGTLEEFTACDRRRAPIIRPN